MFPAQLEKQLSEIEQQCAALAEAVSSGEPVSLEAASTQLRQLAVELARSQEVSHLDAQTMQAFKARLQKVVGGIGAQRGSLARRAAVVERGLNAMMPATRESTYGQAAGPYGAAAKQSGAFKLLTA
ncbi:MAG: hypothetical protein Q8K91_01745 [Hylemonella sp.]|nr:hypothetical protein [Hylemonella sp.]MDP1935910.1 hypothetical protein [Hylemonella sp.]